MNVFWLLVIACAAVLIQMAVFRAAGQKGITYVRYFSASRAQVGEKLELVDEAYQKLLTDEARELLDDAGCAEVEITWGSEPVEPVEAIMRSAGLRDADSGDDAAWDVAGFEKSLLENYGVTPHHYEDLGDGVYQVYVEIDGEIVPFVTVDSATGDYHG